MRNACSIEFENVNDTYWAGQTVRGKIILQDDKVLQAKAVIVKIKGCAHTSWSEERGSGDNKSTTWYGDHVDYIKIKNSLLDFTPSKDIKVDYTQVAVIAPGVRIYPFSCHIPAESPSSMEGLHGYIRYWVQVTFKRCCKFDKTFKKCFSVINVNDLNLSGEFRLPVNAETTKIFCCGPCKSDPLKMVVQLPQAGYVPGQLISVSIWIANDTSARINEICVRLAMMIKYFSTCKNDTISEKKTISKLKGDQVLRYCKKNFNYLLPVPATPPTCLTLCSIIHVTYVVEVEAKMQGMMYRNHSVQTPVTIGNVPLQMEGMVVQQQPMPGPSNPANALREMTSEASNGVKERNLEDPNALNDNVQPWSTFGNITPPVYMEAVHIPRAKLTLDTDHEYGEKDYAPKYPVFDIPSPTNLKPNQSDDQSGPSAAPDRNTWF